MSRLSDSVRPTGAKADAGTRQLIPKELGSFHAEVFSGPSNE